LPQNGFIKPKQLSQPISNDKFLEIEIIDQLFRLVEILDLFPSPTAYGQRCSRNLSLALKAANALSNPSPVRANIESSWL
jgi:hypothetical protein